MRLLDENGRTVGGKAETPEFTGGGIARDNSTECAIRWQGPRSIGLHQQVRLYRDNKIPQDFFLMRGITVSQDYTNSKRPGNSDPSAPSWTQAGRSLWCDSSRAH